MYVVCTQLSRKVPRIEEGSIPGSTYNGRLHEAAIVWLQSEDNAQLTEDSKGVSEAVKVESGHFLVLTSPNAHFDHREKAHLR